MGKKATHKKKTAKKKTAKKTAKKTVSKKKTGKVTATKKKAVAKKTASKTTAKKTTKKKAKTKSKKTTKKTAKLHQGDKVAWDSLNGPTTGTVKRKLTRRAKIKSHTVDASPEQPQYVVASEKTGKPAAHKAKSLRKRK